MIFSGGTQPPAVPIDKDMPGYALVCHAGWVTPETLQRRRPTPERDRLRLFLQHHAVSLLVAVPRGSPEPSLFIVFTGGDHARPFTDPKVLQIQNIAELIDSILTRSRLTEQAALRTRMEHLAMMSRGLAHDLKNLITPVSSFLVHTEDKYAADSPEAEVHSAARRSVRIMTEYVREAIFFSERLAPKFETVDPRVLLDAVRDIATPQADRRQVRLELAPELLTPLVADGVLLQRMLANFVSNAIDASASGSVVALSTRPGSPGYARFEVADRGCGIAPEHLPRIFDAYFTTKEFGDEVRGFGLGLTIARKIADLHGAAIAVHSRLGEGTTFTIDLPLHPPPAAVSTLPTRAAGTAVA